MKNTNRRVYPFLRWAGGKTWLTKYIDEYIPKKFNKYFEPFLGSAAITIHLLNNDKLNGNVYLSDSNSSLIKTYIAVRDQGPDLIKELQKHKNEQEYYYKIRSENFTDAVKAAARFIYLNRTSFNGIYRENLNGEYNVPYGNKKYKVLFDYDNILNLGSTFSNVTFDAFDFEMIVDSANKGDLVFIDPPYTVAHQNNGFIKYNQKIFSWADQERLCSFIKTLDSKGVYIILTNAYHENILQLYSDFGNKKKIERYSVVGGKNADRKKYPELLITNF